MGDGTEFANGSNPRNSASKPAPRAAIYVDFGYTGLPAGTLARPVTRLSEAAVLVSTGGTVNMVATSGVFSTAEVVRLSKAMRLQNGATAPMLIGVQESRSSMSELEAQAAEEPTPAQPFLETGPPAYRRQQGWLVRLVRALFRESVE